MADSKTELSYSETLKQQLLERFPPAKIADQLVAVIQGATVKTEFALIPIEGTDGEITGYERRPVKETVLLKPENQLRGLIVLDVMTGGKVGITKAAEIVNELPSRDYSKWVSPVDSRVIAPQARHLIIVQAPDSEPEPK